MTSDEAAGGPARASDEILDEPGTPAREWLRAGGGAALPLLAFATVLGAAMVHRSGWRDGLRWSSPVAVLALAVGICKAIERIGHGQPRSRLGALGLAALSTAVACAGLIGAPLELAFMRAGQTDHELALAFGSALGDALSGVGGPLLFALVWSWLVFQTLALRGFGREAQVVGTWVVAAVAFWLVARGVAPGLRSTFGWTSLLVLYGPGLFAAGDAIEDFLGLRGSGRGVMPSPAPPPPTMADAFDGHDRELRFAAHLLETGRADDAELVLEGALPRLCRPPGGLVLLALARVMLGRRDEAVALLDEALRLLSAMSSDAGEPFPRQAAAALRDAFANAATDDAGARPA